MRPLRLALLAALAAAAPVQAAPPACQGTLSGAVQGRFDCTVTVTPGGEGNVLFVIEPRAPIPGVPSYSPGAFEIPEPLSVTTYTLESLGQGRASVAAEGGTLYTATKTSSQRGEVHIVLSQVKKAPTAKGSYLVRGTYRARLVPAGAGKQGEVVVDVKF